jgi:SSS family solute:Na+ symporter/sodium/pantothenate symporter
MASSVLLLAQTTASLASKSPGIGAITALVVFIAASVWLGTLAQKVVERSQFIQGYFQGNRGLGPWTIALTATVQSGGTFMGFPSLVYTHGWIVALWIGSYMVGPLIGFGLIGKRIAQISRRSGAVTVPDLFRARFGSPTAGLITSLLIIVFMSIMMIAQFKAGATVMQEAWPFPTSSSTATASTPAAAGNTADVQRSGEPWQAWWLSKRVYLAGLVIFSLSVVGYTLIGGFLAAVWTDLLQSVMMFIGVIILVALALSKTGGLEQASRQAIKNVEQRALADESVQRTPEEARRIASQFAAGPGLRPNGTDFLPLTMAFSMFVFWPFAGTANPASVVRVMACKNTNVLRRSIFLLAVYNMCIYLPLIIICICARAIMPDLGKESDAVVPRMALVLTDGLPLGSWVSGLILAAPFGAIMATVSCFLLVIASGLVRDVYQRFVNPEATEHEMRRLTYFSMAMIGLVAMLLNINPVEKLQMLVTFSSGCAASAFLIPTLMMCYWRRATAPGVMAAMLGGALAAFALNMTGLVIAIRYKTGFVPYNLLGFEPIVWGLCTSIIAGIITSLITRPPDERLISKLFDATAPQAV